MGILRGIINRVFNPAIAGDADAIAELEMKADRLDKDGKTLLHIKSENGYTEHVQFILNKDPNKKHLLKLDFRNRTALHLAAYNGCTGVAEILIHAARDLPVTSFQAFLRQGDKDMDTALHLAVSRCDLKIVKLLVVADPSGGQIQNNKGETPIYIAVERGYMDIVKMICTTCTALSNFDGPRGTTALHAAIKNLHQVKKEDRDVIGIIIEKYANTLRDKVANKSDKDSDEIDAEIYEDLVELFDKTDENRCTILELAVERNCVDVVELILTENPVYAGLMNPHDIGLKPLIYKATDKEYKDIVTLLTKAYENPKHLYSASPAALLRGGDLKEHSFCRLMIGLISAIEGRKREIVFKMLADITYVESFVSFADNLGWTALHHAAYHEFDSIIKVLVEVQKKIGHKFIYEDKVSTPFHIAAAKGYTSTIILLMQLWPSSSSLAYTAVDGNGQNILHLAALQSRKELIQGILKNCREEYMNEFVNKQDVDGNTPLHILIRYGCFVPELMKYKDLDTVIRNKEKWTPRDMLYFEDQIIEDQVQVKIALDDVENNHKMDISESLVLPSKRREKDVIFNERAKAMMHENQARMKEDLESYKKTHAIGQWYADAVAGHAIAKAALEMKADTLNKEEETILHLESKKGDAECVRYIVTEFAEKNLLGKLDRFEQTALHLAAYYGHTQVVEVLIDAARCNWPSSSANNDPVSCFHAFVRQPTAQKQNTALHLAVIKGNLAIVELLLEADPNDRHVPNNEGKTPIYIAAEKGCNDIIKVICTTCTALCLDGPAGSTTALHAAILNINHGKEEDRDVIRMMIDAAKRWSSAADSPTVSFEALFNKRDISGRTVLELAVDTNYADIVERILQENPVYEDGRGSKNGLMRLIFKATEKKYTDIVKLLSETYEAGITTGHKGVVDLILAIYRRDEDSVIRLLGDANHLVTFADDEGWTPLHYAAYHEFVSILDVIINALKDVKYQFEYGDMISTPFHVAAERKYTSTVIRLMQLWPASSSAYTATNKNGQNILHLAAAYNKKEMILGILKHCPEEYKDKILEQQDNDNGDTPLHLLASNGCYIPELINHKGLDTMATNKKNWTPRDMLYSKDEIIADQVQIKIALDNIQTNQSWKFWRKNMEKKTDISKSLVVRPSKIEIKDVIFNEYTKLLMDEKSLRKKKDLEPYKNRTNTQIIVTALITTVTFTVGFTMPGGLRQSGGKDEGSAVLSKKKAFNACMISDALALLLSTSSLFFYFLQSMNEDPHQVSILNAASTVLNIFSIIAMILTFITGTYVVLFDSQTLAIIVCTIGSLFFLLLIIVLMIKVVHDCLVVKRNID